MLIGAVAGALVVGFLAGLLSFRVKSRWCGVCGSTFACVECATGRPALPALPVEERSRIARP